MKVKALKHIVFGNKSFKEGNLYDVKETKGLNPKFFEAIGDVEHKTKEKTSEASIPKVKEVNKTKGRLKKTKKKTK